MKEGTLLAVEKNRGKKNFGDFSSDDDDDKDGKKGGDVKRQM